MGGEFHGKEGKQEAAEGTSAGVIQYPSIFLFFRDLFSDLRIFFVSCTEYYTLSCGQQKGVKYPLKPCFHQKFSTQA